MKVNQKPQQVKRTDAFVGHKTPVTCQMGPCGNLVMWTPPHTQLFIFHFNFNSLWWRGAEGETGSPAGLAPSAQADLGLDLTTLRSWPERESGAGWFTDGATQAPPCPALK